MNSSETARECERDLRERRHCESVRENDEPAENPEIRECTVRRGQVSRIQISDEIRRYVETSNHMRFGGLT